MKKVIIFLLFFFSLIDFSLAYTPTQQDKQTVEAFTEKFEDFREKVSDERFYEVMNRLKIISDKYSRYPQVNYILSELHANLIVRCNIESSIYGLDEIFDIDYSIDGQKAIIIAGKGEWGYEGPQEKFVGEKFLISLELINGNYKKITKDSLLDGGYFYNDIYMIYGDGDDKYIRLGDEVFGPYKEAYKQYTNKGKNYSIIVIKDLDGNIGFIDKNLELSKTDYKTIISYISSDDDSSLVYVATNSEGYGGMGYENLGDTKYLVNSGNLITTFTGDIIETGFCNDTNNLWYKLEKYSDGKTRFIYEGKEYPEYDIVNLYGFSGDCSLPKFVGINSEDSFSQFSSLHYGDQILATADSNIGSPMIFDEDNYYYEIYKEGEDGEYFGKNSGYKLYHNKDLIEGRGWLQKYEIMDDGSLLYGTSLRGDKLIIMKGGKEDYVLPYTGTSGPHMDYLFLSPDGNNYASLLRNSKSNLIINGKNVLSGFSNRGGLFDWTPDSKYLAVITDDDGSTFSIYDKYGNSIIKPVKGRIPYSGFTKFLDGDNKLFFFSQSDNTLKYNTCEWK